MIKLRGSGSAEEQHDKTIDGLLSEAAAANPLFAGGSAAALGGAFAAALGEMMAGLTEGREKFSSVQVQVLEAHTRLTRLRKILRSLVEEDSKAFNALLNAKILLPRENDEQKAIRSETIEKLTMGATITPLRTARAALEVLELLKTLLDIGNPHAVCDVAAGAQLAYASLKSSQYNVLANIRDMKDTSFVENCRREIADLASRGERILNRIDTLVNRR